MSSKYSYDELKRFLEEKIRGLKRELEFYEALLTELEGSKGREKQDLRKPAKEEVIALRDSDGNVVATITVTQSRIKVVPLVKIESDHRLVKSYLIKFLNEKKTSSVGRVANYDIKSANGLVSEIVIDGSFNEYFVVELEAAIQYIINSLSGKTQQ